MASLTMLDNERNAMQKPNLKLVIFTVLIFYFFLVNLTAILILKNIM